MEKYDRQTQKKIQFAFNFVLFSIPRLSIYRSEYPRLNPNFFEPERFLMRFPMRFKKRLVDSFDEFRLINIHFVIVLGFLHYLNL